MPVSVPSTLRFRLASLAILAGGLALAGNALAQEAKPEPTPKKPADLGTELEAIRAKHGPPGLGAAVVRGDGTIAIGVAGVRRSTSKDAVTVDDRWHIGSCTKAFTTTLVARLVEKKKLAFELTLAKAFPKVDVHDDWKAVTLESLMRNRGGAPPDLNADGLWGRLWQQKGTHREQRMQLVRGVLPKRPHVKPGTRFVYSNAGFALVGAAAEETLDTSWEDLLRKHVLKPLGMKDAGFGAPGAGGTKKDAEKQPWGHAARGELLVPMPPGPAADNPPAIGPGATLHCTLRDWAKFAAVHLRGARGESTGFLEPATFRRLHAAKEGHTYALGWSAREVERAGGLVLGHDGSNTMWYARIQILPARNVAVVVTCNAANEGAKKAVAEAANGLLRTYARE